MPFILINNVTLKVACISCIKGHRVAYCEHFDRILIECRAAGRPAHGTCACSMENRNGGCRCSTRTAYVIPGHKPTLVKKASSMGKAIPDYADIVTNAVISDHQFKDDPVKPRPDPRSRKAIARAAQARQAVKAETGESSSDDSVAVKHEPETPHEPTCNCGGGMPHTHAERSVASIQHSFAAPATQRTALYSNQLPVAYPVTGQHMFLQQEGYTFPTPSANADVAFDYFQAQSLNYLPGLANGVTTHFTANSHCAQGTLSNLYPVGVVTPNHDLTTDNCQCSSEATCTCEGCLDHPRNRATLHHVMEALDFVATHPKCLEDNTPGGQIDDIPQDILQQLPEPDLSATHTPQATTSSMQSGHSTGGGCCGSKRQLPFSVSSSAQTNQQHQTAHTAPPNPLTLHSTYNPNIHRQPSLNNLNQSLLNTPLNMEIAQQYQQNNTLQPSPATAISSSMTSTPTGFYGHGQSHGQNSQHVVPVQGSGLNTISDQMMSSAATQHYMTQGLPVDPDAVVNDPWIAAYNPYAAVSNNDTSPANNMDMSAFLHGDPMMGAPAVDVQNGGEQDAHSDSHSI